MRFAAQRSPTFTFTSIHSRRILGLHRSHFFLLLLFLLVVVPFLWWSTSAISEEETNARAGGLKVKRRRHHTALSVSSSTGISSSSSSKQDEQAQELANRILEMNGLNRNTNSHRDAPNHRWAGPSSIQTEEDGGISPILPAPKVGEHEYSEQDSLLEEAENCPPVEAPPDMDLIEFFGQGHKSYDEVKYLPRIPSLYEPHAPKALWLPPIPISKNKDSPSIFNVHPVTGKSSSKIVWNIYANMDPASAAAESTFHKGHIVNGAPVNLQVSSPQFAPRSLLNPDFVPGPPMTCDRLALRTRAYWQSWSKQTLEQKPLNVLVWHGNWEKTTTEAKAGGPLGELSFFTSTMLALTALSAKVTFLAHPQGEGEMISSLKSFDQYDIILIDPNSSEVLSQHKYLENPDVLCRLRVLDYLGSPDRQHSWKLPSPSQYLVPFACSLDGSTPNALLYMHRYKNLAKEDDVESFEPSAVSYARAKAEHEAQMKHESHRLKFSEAEKLWPVQKNPHFFENTANLHPRGSTWDLLQTASIEAAGRKFAEKENPGGDANYANLFHKNKLRFHGPKFAKKFQILVWGKEPKYFAGLKPLLRVIAEIVPIVTVVKEAGKALFPYVGDLPRTADGYERIRHMGILSQTEMKTLMEESALLMGVGDPIFSFTPLEALQVGTPYLNPNFIPAKTHRNEECVVTSQHPYAEKLGAPQTWNFNTQDLKNAQLVVKTALKWIHDTQKVLGGIPSLYPKELEFKHLVKRLNENFRTDFCEQHGRKATPAHRKN